MRDQSREVKVFATRHGHAIKRTQQLVLASFGRVESALGSDCGIRAARDCLETFDVRSLVLANRRIVDALIPEKKQHRRWALWHLHDILGHLCMAIETRWPYETQERRVASLRFAREEAREMSAALERC